MCDSEHSVVVDRRLSTLSNFSFLFMCATAQKAAWHIGIVAVTTLGGKTSVPYADTGGSNESAA
jgi:hypothetical protein